jgi:signal transduction histidine kinase
MQSTSAVVQYSQMPDVPMDKGTFSRIFQNLPGNAMKYRGPDPPRIEVAAWRGPREWIFSVSDNGEGIAHEYRERVFEPFRRLHGRQIPGSGIGLSLCREMISQYGGRIWFDSEPGEGATFFFTVPDANVTPGEGEGRQNSQ